MTRTIAGLAVAIVLASGGPSEADDGSRPGQYIPRDRPGHQNIVASVAFSPDGKSLASGSSDGTTRLWNLSTGKEVVAAQQFQGEWVWSIAFSPGGKVLASGVGEKGINRLCDASTGKGLATFKGHARSTHTVAFSADGKLLSQPACGPPTDR